MQEGEIGRRRNAGSGGEQVIEWRSKGNEQFASLYVDDSMQRTAHHYFYHHIKRSTLAAVRLQHVEKFLQKSALSITVLRYFVGGMSKYLIGSPYSMDPAVH